MNNDSQKKFSISQIRYKRGSLPLHEEDVD